MSARPAQARRNFAITGVGGVVAPRHLKAIKDTQSTLVAAFDPNDSVGVLDDHSALDVPFFTDGERFERHLVSLQESAADERDRVHYVSVCSPNHMHDSQCRLGLRLGADVICEKPVVIDPPHLDALESLEAETGHRIWTILQLRTHESLMALRESLASTTTTRHDVVLTYITARGRWYDASWKGDVEKSGGIATNIGVHMFDLLMWLFGKTEARGLHLREPRRMAGYLELERARVSWLLSVDSKDMPPSPQPQAHGTPEQRALRTISIDGTVLDFSTGFSVLHTRVYERTLRGEGFGLAVARPSIELAHEMRHADVESPTHLLHPLLRR